MSSAVGFNDNINGIRPGREQFKLTAFGAELIFPVKNKTADHAALAVILAALFLAVDHTVAQLHIVTAEVIKFAHKILFRQSDDFILAGLGNAEQTVKLITEHRIITFDFGTDITVFAIPADLDIAECRLLTVDFIKVFDFCPSGIMLAVFIQKFLQILNGVIIEMRKIPAELFHQIKDLPQFTLVLLNIKAADTLHRQSQQFVDILIGHIAFEQRTVRCKSGMDLGIFFFFAAALLDPFIDTVFKKELSQCFGVKEF